MIFKKRKGNQNKIKPPGRKRKIVATIALSLSLLFGKAQLSSSQSSSPNFGNQKVHQRLIDDREFNLKDQQVILAKGENNPITPPTNRGPSSFTTPPSGGRPSRPATGINPYSYRTPPRIVDQGLGAAANPAGAGNGGGNAEFDDNNPSSKKEQSQESKTFDYRSNDPQKKKKSKDQCPIHEQNKAGIDSLPDSSEFTYNLETKTAKKALKKVWKNTEAKKEVLAGLDRMNKGELLPRNQKNFKGFKTLKEIKLTDTRMLVQPGKNGDPDQIVAIFMRRDLENIASIFKGKYK